MQLSRLWLYFLSIFISLVMVSFFATLYFRIFALQRHAFCILSETKISSKCKHKRCVYVVCKCSNHFCAANSRQAATVKCWREKKKTTAELRTTNRKFGAKNRWNCEKCIQLKHCSRSVFSLFGLVLVDVN